MLGDDARAEGEARTIQSADGLPLFVRDYAPTMPVTGLPVICLHGLTRNSRDFELVAPRIAALGRRVLALDVRGRGQSARDRDPTHYSPVVYTQDVLTILDRLGISRAVFLGTSMGGIITMVVAATQPARVAAAILNDVGPVLESAGYQRIAGYVGKNMEFPSAEAALAAIKSVQGSAYPDRDDLFWRNFMRRTCRTLQDGRVAFDYDQAIAQAFEGGAGPADLTSLFESLAKTGPLLVVQGALSDLLSAEGVDLMRIVKHDLQAVHVPGVGHAPTLEEETAWLAIIDFLAIVD